MGPREFYEEVDSTQDRAVGLARDGAESGTRVVARRQSRGRGRLDHAWSSPPGGLYLSVILPAPRRHASLLPIGVGARVADDLGRAYGRQLAVKWPNDVLAVDDGDPPRKLAGILVDRVPSPRYGFAAVVGVGVNVTTNLSHLPPDVAAAAAALAGGPRTAPEIEDVEDRVVRAAVATVRALDAPGGVDGVRSLARSLLYGVGRRALVDGRPAGTIAALGDDGELLLDSGTDRVAIRAGDLRLEGTA